MPKSSSDYGVRNLDDGREVLASLPNLARRVANFSEAWLEDEPCTNDGHCVILSNSNRMCPACRLRLAFFHCVYNAEMYDETLGEEHG